MNKHPSTHLSLVEPSWCVQSICAANYCFAERTINLFSTETLQPPLLTHTLTRITPLLLQRLMSGTLAGAAVRAPGVLAATQTVAMAMRAATEALPVVAHHHPGDLLQPYVLFSS